ncbi:FAD dependent oxidoreductase [Podospora aff. communis PSN243]|uniref:FAD dependent oxidoreductase n=1 Tax=Podospora aff. communis PSN243 TaxID=3040156 RepID=A0AAV9H4M7_9PEZI|nr:FAD dependent oxidoreductase [Podospora aff. communis PSN243]
MSPPQSKNVVIIGGGIVGTTTAYYLTRNPSYDPATHSIVLLEAVGIAAGSSGKGGGFIASWATPRCIAPLSFKLHQDLAQEHDGEKVWGFRTVHAAEIGIQAREPDGDREEAGSDDRRSALDWLFPGSVKAYKEIGIPADTGQVHPQLFCKSIAELAKAAGVSIVFGTATSINHDEGGSHVMSVTYTSQGAIHELPATDILVAAGPWTAMLLPQVKLRAPKGHSIVVRPSRDEISPYILFPDIRSSTAILSPDIYPRPSDALNSFSTVYASGPDYYDVALPNLASDVTVESEKVQDVWKAAKSVSQEIQDGTVITKQACYKAQIRKHEENEEIGPLLGRWTSVAFGLRPDSTNGESKMVRQSAWS